MEKRSFLILFLLLAALSLAGIVFYPLLFTAKEETLDAKETVVTFKNTTVRAETAGTSVSRIHGLSGHAPLKDGEGMWFDFGASGIHGIWMKEMLFPLDILWFNDNLRLVYMKENAEPSSYPEIFTPSSPSQFVLEVPAGFVKKNGVVLGETVSVQNTR